MSKDDAISIMNNSSLNEKLGQYKFFSLYIKDKWNHLLSKKQRSDVK